MKDFAAIAQAIHMSDDERLAALLRGQDPEAEARRLHQRDVANWESERKALDYELWMQELRLSGAEAAVESLQADAVPKDPTRAAQHHVALGNAESHLAVMKLRVVHVREQIPVLEGRRP